MVAVAGRGRSCPAAPPDPRSGVSCSPQPCLQVGKLRQRIGVAIEHLHRHLPGRATSPPEQQQDGEGSDAGGKAPGGTGHDPALARDPLESWALVEPAGSSPAEEHGRGIRLRSPPSLGRARMETSQQRVEKLRGSSLENSAGNSSACKTPRFVQMLKNAKTLHQNAAPVQRRCQTLRLPPTTTVPLLSLITPGIMFFSPSSADYWVLMGPLGNARSCHGAAHPSPVGSLGAGGGSGPQIVMLGDSTVKKSHPGCPRSRVLFIPLAAGHGPHSTAKPGDACVCPGGCDPAWGGLEKLP